MKKHLLTFVMTVIMVVGCTASAFAAELVGYINTDRVFNSHPEIQSVQQALDLELTKAKQEFQAKADKLDDKGKQELAQKLDEGIKKKEISLMKPIQEKIRKAIETVAKNNGISSIVDAKVMIYGGKDLTDEVIAIVAAGK